MIKAVIFDCFGVFAGAGGHKDILKDVLRLRSSYKTAVLSNTSEATLRKLFSGDTVERYFDELVLSYEEGIAKPNPEIFLMTAKRLGVRPEECVFIDDSEDNILAAKSIGMKVILYRGEEDFRRKLSRFGVSI